MLRLLATLMLQLFEDLLLVSIPSESLWYSSVNEDHMSKIMLMSVGEFILHSRKIEVFSRQHAS